MFAALGVIDAIYFKGRYLNDFQTSVVGLASLSTQIGRR
jgi:serine protease inhibitor